MWSYDETPEQKLEQLLLQDQRVVLEDLLLEAFFSQ